MRGKRLQGSTKRFPRARKKGCRDFAKLYFRLSTSICGCQSSMMEPGGFFLGLLAESILRFLTQLISRMLIRPCKKAPSVTWTLNNEQHKFLSRSKQHQSAQKRSAKKCGAKNSKEASLTVNIRPNLEAWWVTCHRKIAYYVCCNPSVGVAIVTFVCTRVSRGSKYCTLEHEINTRL